MRRTVLLVFVGVQLCAAPAWGAELASARDASVDTALLADGGMGGVLPPTGAQVAAPAGTNWIGPAVLGPRELRDARGAWRPTAFGVKGIAKVSAKGKGPWQAVSDGTIIRKGDVILTERESAAAIAFSRDRGNALYIPENTRAAIRSIDPVDVYLEDGTVYNVVSRLPAGSRWKVSTPVAIAAVRGTFYLVNFVAADGSFASAVFDVPDDGESSSVSVVQVLGEGEGPSVDVPEGNQIELRAGQAPDPWMIEDIDPRWLEAFMRFFAHLFGGGTGGGPLPPTGALGSSPPAGNPNGSYDDNFDKAYDDPPGGLDPLLDTDSIFDAPPPADSSSSSSPSDTTGEPPPEEGGNEPPPDEGGGDTCPNCD